MILLGIQKQDQVTFLTPEVAYNAIHSRHWSCRRFFELLTFYEYGCSIAIYDCNSRVFKKVALSIEPGFSDPESVEILASSPVTTLKTSRKLRDPPSIALVQLQSYIEYLGLYGLFNRASAYPVESPEFCRNLSIDDIVKKKTD